MAGTECGPREPFRSAWPHFRPDSVRIANKEPANCGMWPNEIDSTPNIDFRTLPLATAKKTRQAATELKTGASYYRIEAMANRNRWTISK